jgi:hypothetical protein
LRSKGLIFLIAPSRGPEHLYPVDCWRFLPDGYRALAKYSGGVEVVEVETDRERRVALDGPDWGDTVGVFRKIAGSSLRERVSDPIRFARRAWRAIFGNEWASPGLRGDRKERARPRLEPWIRR